MTVHNLFLFLLIILFLVLILISVILFIGYKQFEKSLQRTIGLNSVDRIITNAIIQQENKEEDVIKFQFLLKLKSFRNLFLDRLVQAEKKFSGNAHTEIIGLFSTYQLQKDIFAKLKSTKPFVIAQGIQEITAVKSADSAKYIEPFLKHQDPMVYNEAQFAVVKLNGIEGIRFLEHFSYKMSNWQQIRLLSSIKEVTEDQYEILNNLWKSENSSVLVFALKVVRNFQLLHFYNHVKQLLNHSNNKVKKEAIETLQHIENEDTLNDLIEIYSNENVDMQLVIIKALVQANDKRCISFFKTEFLQQTNPALQFQIAQLLVGLNAKDFLIDTNAHFSANHQVSLIINHVLQIR